MNGRTAQESRIPVNGSANGTNGHGPQSTTHLQPPAADQSEGSVGDNPQPKQSSWQPGEQVAEIRTDQPPRSEWLSEVRDRPRVQNGTTLRQFNTPVRVDEIAVAAMTLAEDLQAATQSMPDSTELRRFRQELDQAATTFREMASKLEATAGKLVRLAANEGQVCGVGWGVCPEHGLTLMNIGDTATCHVLGCGRQNEGEVERCEHPVAYKVVDAAGPALLTCSGHAIACRMYFDNPVITATADSMELF
ncbi:hypothetical protein EV645_6000 [Kribbella rubisoli]|uniref:Uncharacterized protein n=1 Tax=Kribbella rubisoli TaxID=3075929 RepID=A0A4Q7WMQ0_9ACTN|nr:hypothetical protein EV645_6000 [Kribbella rubisoli]